MDFKLLTESWNETSSALCEGLTPAQAALVKPVLALLPLLTSLASAKFFCQLSAV